mmetsp:Transcript_66775/g.204363  ORF Transcript_66775/g.204363 Transcript_66775/m.204363 type:complete len:344 (-) Transcript_66775:4439-5470(-)
MLDPHRWRLPVENLEKCALQLRTHQQQAFDRFLDVLQRAVDDLDQAVEPRQLLQQHRVHALLVHGRVHLLNLREIPSFRQSRQDVPRDVADHLVGASAAAGAARRRSQQQLLHHVVRLAHLLGQVGVLVEPEDTGRRHQRQRGDVLQVRLVASRRRRPVHGPVSAGVEQLEIVLQRLNAVVLLEQRREQAPVHGLCDPASVVALASQVIQRRDWRLVGVIVQEHHELARGNAQVIFCELVRNIPPQRSEEAPLLDDSVEEAQAENEPLERRLVGARLEELLLRQRIHVVRARHVGPQALRRLVGHLDAILKNGHREFVRRVRREPQTETRIRFLWVRLLQYAI